VADRLGHDYRYAINGARAAQELGYEPQQAFADALKSTVVWYAERVRAQTHTATRS